MPHPEVSPEPVPLLVDLPEADLLELPEMNASRHDWIDKQGRKDRGKTRGDYKPVVDFLASSTDPDSSLMPRVMEKHHDAGPAIEAPVPLEAVPSASDG